MKAADGNCRLRLFLCARQLDDVEMDEIVFAAVVLILLLFFQPAGAAGTGAALGGSFLTSRSLISKVRVLPARG